jgi:hypothetical protein
MSMFNAKKKLNNLYIIYKKYVINKLKQTKYGHQI